VLLFYEKCYFCDTENEENYRVYVLLIILGKRKRWYKEKEMKKWCVRSVLLFLGLSGLIYFQNTPQDLEDRVVFFTRNQELALFMGNNFTATPSPNSFGYFLKTSIGLKNDWKAGTWHHVAFKWKKIGQNRYLVGPVYLDGIPSTNLYQSEYKFNPVNWMFYGTNRFKDMISNGYPLTADATIQSIRAYSKHSIVDPSNNQGYLIPDRYLPSKANTYEGTIFDFWANGVPKIKGITILGISWTERIPQDGGDIYIDLKLVRPKQTTNPNDPYEIVKEFPRLGKDDGPCYCYDAGGAPLNHLDADKCWTKKGVEVGFQLFKSGYIPLQGNEKLIFKATFKLPQTVPVLESSYLEDVTVSVITGEPKIIRSWEEAKPKE
jgi:hypothetical protein